MLCVHFTAEDLTAISIATEPEPLCETLLSLDVVRLPEADLVFGAWRRKTIAQLPPERVSTFELRPLIRQLLRRSAALSAARERRSGAEWIKDVVGVVTTTDLVDAIGAHWRVSVEPYWNLVRALVRADAAHRGRVALTGGTTKLLSTLHPDVWWRPPVMHVRNGPAADLFLNGAGMVLLPSVFCWPAPFLIHEPGTPAVLLFPALRSPNWATDAHATAHPGGGIAPLLGTTRAAILEATARPGRSTTKIAQCVQVSLPTVSQHTSVLRNAGLITTRRQGVAVVHEITELGIALLSGGLTPVASRATS
jgi:DNA-binding transcriptional ArsR family regulator